MDERTFNHEIHKAKTYVATGKRPNYWIGYQNGLRRLYQGEKFVTDGDHAVWLSLVNSDRKDQIDRGHGYRDGFNFDANATK